MLHFKEIKKSPFNAFLNATIAMMHNRKLLQPLTFQKNMIVAFMRKYCFYVPLCKLWVG